MRYKKLLIVLFSSFLLLFLIMLATKTYPVIITDKISQHPHHFYPKIQRSYDALLYGIFPIILELSKPTICKLTFINGNIEKVMLGDGSGTTEQNYSEYHMFGKTVYCIR